MINHHYDKITSIVCDLCMDEEFVPVLEQEFEGEMYMAWEQAVSHGWLMHWLGDFNEWGHCCPRCATNLWRRKDETQEPKTPEAAANDNEGSNDAA